MIQAVFCDLDGSLHCSQAGFHPLDLKSLKELGQQGITRVIATGRNLYSACLVLEPDFPIDYLVFASGAGILNWQTRELMIKHQLRAEQTQILLRTLQQLQLDFMLHAPLPDNHHFWYQQYSTSNLDFDSRMARYPSFGQALDWQKLPESISQALVVCSAEQTLETWEKLQKHLPGFSLVRATSPLDGQSGWLEIFPAQVSKAQAAQWLCEQLNIHSHLAFGNDYNDSDLLAWAAYSFVVSSAPAELSSQYPQVAEPAQAGFSQALQLLWQQAASC